MGLLDILNPLLGPILDRVIPDPVERHAYELKMADIADREAQREHDEMIAQTQTNTAEANNKSIFVAGWRPFIGWVGGIGLAYSFVVNPVASWTAQVIFHYHGSFPALDTGQLMDLVMGMLGFGGLRTYEKIKGVPDSSLTVQPSGSTAPVIPPKKKVLGISWPF